MLKKIYLIPAKKKKKYSNSGHCPDDGWSCGLGEDYSGKGLNGVKLWHPDNKKLRFDGSWKIPGVKNISPDREKWFLALDGEGAGKGIFKLEAHWVRFGIITVTKAAHIGHLMSLV